MQDLDKVMELLLDELDKYEKALQFPIAFGRIEDEEVRLFHEGAKSALQILQERIKEEL